MMKSVKQLYGPAIDWKRVHCVGYSMGSRGCWRYSEASSTVGPTLPESKSGNFVLKHPLQTLATTVSIGGAAEKAGDKNLVLEPTTPTFPYLNKITRLQIRQHAGTQDTTAPVSNAQSTQNELLQLGAKASSLYYNNVDHTGLQTAPFNVDLLSWLLAHKQVYDQACKPVSTSTALLPPAPRTTKRTVRHAAKAEMVH